MTLARRARDEVGDPPAPRAPPPKGWKRARRRKQRTFDDDFPTFGAKLRFIVTSALALICLGLALLAFAASGYTWLLAEDAGQELGYMLALMGAGVFLVFVAGMIEPFSERRPRKDEKK